MGMLRFHCGWAGLLTRKRKCVQTHFDRDLGPFVWTLEAERFVFGANSTPSGQRIGVSWKAVRWSGNLTVALGLC